MNWKIPLIHDLNITLKPFFCHFCLFTCLHNCSLPNQERPPWPSTDSHIAIATGRPLRYEQWGWAEGAGWERGGNNNGPLPAEMFSPLTHHSRCWSQTQISRSPKCLWWSPFLKIQSNWCSTSASFSSTCGHTVAVGTCQKQRPLCYGVILAKATCVWTAHASREERKSLFNENVIIYSFISLQQEPGWDFFWSRVDTWY